MNIVLINYSLTRLIFHNIFIFMTRFRHNNPLKKRRVDRGLTQKQLSEKLGVTQSQYSKIETGEIDPTKHLRKLSKILKCDPNDVFSGQILKDMEEEFLNDPIKETQCIYHQRNPEKVYVKMEGWFTEEELSRFLIWTIDGIGRDNKC